MFKAFGRKNKTVSKEKEKDRAKNAEQTQQLQDSYHQEKEQAPPSEPQQLLERKEPENAMEQYKSTVAHNRENGTDEFPKEPRSNAPLHEDDFGMIESRHSLSSELKSEAKPLTSQLPDYMADQNAVLIDNIPWRHGHTPDYSAANNKFKKERTHVWPPGSLEDVVSNLVKNWEKEASYKIRLEDWRTINTRTYRFSCNGGRGYTADEMMEIGTYNALIQEAAFYSAKHTSFDDSHKIFRDALPDGFPWEVTEVYSGPPVIAFKWRHWGKMTGKLVCPVGPETKLEALPTNQEVELFGVCVAHMDSDLKLSKLEIFYDPHELMASLVDARNLSYSSKPDDKEHCLQDGIDFKRMAMNGTESSEEDSFSSDPESGTDNLNQADFVPPHMLRIDPQTNPGMNNGAAGIRSRTSPASDVNVNKQGEGKEPSSAVADLKAWQKTLSKEPLGNTGQVSSFLPSDDNLLASIMEKPKKSLPGSRCPFPHN